MDLEKYTEKMISFLPKQLSNKDPMFSKVLHDFTAAEDSGGGYLYYHLSEQVTAALVTLAALRTLLSNMADHQVLYPEKIESGTPLVYAETSYTFIGVEKHDGHDICKMASDSDGLLLTIPRETFLSSVSLAKSVSSRKTTDTRAKVAAHFHISHFSRTDESNIVILTDKAVIDSLEKMNFTIEGRDLSFGAVVPSEYYNAGGKTRHLKGTTKTMVPMVTFVPKLQTLNTLLHERVNKHFTLYMIGDAWWKYSNKDMLANVRDFIIRHSVETHILSMLSSAVSAAGATFMSAMDTLYSWLTADEFKTSTISANFIQTDATIDAESAEIDEFLASIRGQQLFDLERSLQRFQQTLFSSIDSNSSKVAQAFQSVKSEMQLQNIVAEDTAKDLLQHLTRLVKENYAVQLDNLLSGLIIDNRTVILTHSALAEEMKTNYYVRKKKARVIDYGEPIHSINRRQAPERLIMIVPQISERRRWMYAGIAREVTIVAPNNFARQLATSLSIDLFFLKQILQIDQLVDVDSGSTFVNSISKLKNSLTLRSKEDSELILEEDSDSLEREESILNDGAEEQRSKTFPAATRDNHVVAKYRLAFLENKRAKMFVTPSATILTRDHEGILRHKPIADFKPMDEVAYVQRVENERWYQNDFSKLFNSAESLTKLFENHPDHQKDFEWKQAFIKYVRSNHLTPNDLVQKFLRYGLDHTQGYFRYWSQPSSVKFVPQDLEFIRIIGQLTNNLDIEENAEAYRQSSIAVRDWYQDQRQQALDRIEGQKLDMTDTPISFMTIATITPVSEYLPRYRTNRLLED
ncbi:hypothetical protein [Lacticaseibacillus zeae]|uniref:hypothetical protein n=1 Tax=Lacticaseibacillus zeae TaxID=57037 RepID=UPI000A91804D|nr:MULTISPECIES: hypothetical protein [Lacticaseibacillus]MDE3315771.1 hypothetical protein [Lacticaseibacillus zeae]WLV85563.1 hypothetical protein LACZS1_001953 [Lacticaseibacillus sp. NCIMB 15474]